MERSRHRIRTLPTQELIKMAVELLLDARLDPLGGSIENHRRAAKLFRELQRRTDAQVVSSDCTCADCMADLWLGDAGADPFP